MSDPFIEQMLQRAALRLHDAEACEERVSEMAPTAPNIADEENVTPDEHDEIRRYLAAYEAHRAQRDAAKADLDDASRAHADAYRLATGVALDPIGSQVMADAVNVRGAASVCRASAPPVAPTPSTGQRTAPRPRGAGRPRASATRSSKASGDSGDDAPGEPPPPAGPRLAPPSRAVFAFGCLTAEERS